VVDHPVVQVRPAPRIVVINHGEGDDVCTEKVDDEDCDDGGSHDEIDVTEVMVL
jgi:hypothetical protein